MVSNEASPLEVILYEGRDSRPLDAELRFSLMTGLLDRGYAVTRVSPDGGTRTAPRSHHLLVLADFNGAPPVLQDEAGEVELSAGCRRTRVGGNRRAGRADS